MIEREVTKMARKKTKSYPESFRREAVKLADQPDRTAADVAGELGIHFGQIYNWRRQFKKLSKKQFTNRSLQVGSEQPARLSLTVSQHP